MKRFIFLFLLLFTSISAYLKDYKVIKKPGLYIWDVYKDLSRSPAYVDMFFSNSSQGISDSSHRQLGSNLKSRTPNLNTDCTYIILKIDDIHNFSLFYWVGAQSSKQQRRNVGIIAGFIFKHRILTENTGVHLKVFNREAEGTESRLFHNLFRLPESKKDLRLYRVAGSRGQFIMEVPLKYSELNGSDSFVLQKEGKVFLWNSTYSNENKRRQANLLSKRILNYDMELRSSKKIFYWENETEVSASELYRYGNFETNFLEDMKDIQQPLVFPQMPFNYSDTQLANKKKNELKITEYYWNNVRVDENNIPSINATLDIFKEENAYVIKHSYCGNTFVFLGRNANLQQVMKSLFAAEAYSTGIIRKVEDAWQRVKIFRQGQKLPTYFRIYFEN